MQKGATPKDRAFDLRHMTPWLGPNHSSDINRRGFNGLGLKRGRAPWFGHARNLNLAGLQSLGQFTHQINVQHPILGLRPGHVDMVGQLKGLLE